jgi:hypothetical protein
VESPHPGGFLIDTFTVGMKTFAFPLWRIMDTCSSFFLAGSKLL